MEKGPRPEMHLELQETEDPKKKAQLEFEQGIMPDIRTVVPALAKAIEQSHEQLGKTGGGHDFIHAVRVSHYALRISESWDTALLSAIAGLSHNADRLLENSLTKKRKEVPREKIVDLINSWLDTETWIEPGQREQIINAVILHDRINDSDGPDDELTIILKDADRLANICRDQIIRSGQFRPHLPVVHPDDLIGPASADFKNPRSILDDERHVLEWENDERVKIRLPKARALAEKKFARLRNFLEELLEEYREVGLIS